MKKQFTIFLILIFILGLIPVNFSFAITQNQINAEVQIWCPDGLGHSKSGSGTIIDQKGIILTNRHVIEGAYQNVCFIGFIESINKEPNFGTDENPNLAEVKYITTTEDMDAAILYLDNPTNKIYPHINIWDSNSDSLQFNDKIEVIGFPGIGGSTITYTSGDFSGFGSISDGTQNYIKTIAPIGHGNSGGASYNLKGQFVGIPTFVVSDELNSISYLLSVNSIKNWLSGFLGNSYRQEIEKQKPIIEKPTINLQNDITPPIQKKFYIVFYALDENEKEIYRGIKSDKNSSVAYEFPKIRFAWDENCASDTEYCINDDSGPIKGYYYYFGQNPNTIPMKDGRYISADQLIKPEKGIALVKLPEIFQVKQDVKNYFILQAEDRAGNLSNPLINFEYTYEPDKFKDIKNISIHDKNDNLLGKLFYPTPDEIPAVRDNPNVPDSMSLDYTVTDIYTNQKILYLYPDYGYDIDGLTYYISYGYQFVFNDQREGKNSSNKFIKIVDIDKNKEINIYAKPNKNSLNKFTSKYLILRIHYKSTLTEKIEPKKKGSSYEGELKYQKINVDLINKLSGSILLQVESHGEAWYVNPVDGKRYYMKDGSTAYQMMRNFGLGIKNSDLVKIPRENEKNNYSSFVNKQKGKILLQVEDHGEAWYVNPKTGYRHYMKDGEAAYNLMRYYSTGITNKDLEKIPEGSL